VAESGMTLREAASYLSVSDRTVREYVKKGYLTIFRKKGDRKHWLRPLEVEEFRRDRDEAEGQSIISKRAFLEMRAEVRRLRAELDVVLRILDSKMEPLRMGKAYAKELFEVCTAQLNMTSWSLGEMEPWVEIFLRVDEEDFRTVAQAVDVQRPWKPFLQLCSAMAVSTVTNPQYETSLQLQGLHRQLAEGRRRLRISAMIYSEMYGAVDSDLDRYSKGIPGTVTDSLQKILGKKRG
jgi:excisionase family DNA binding protein